MSDDRNKSLGYERIPYDDIEKLLQVFNKRFDVFLSLKGFPPETVKHISNFTLIDIIIRVDKRKAYYQCFHHMEINECKEAALYAYWILKLRPFTITDSRYSKMTDACHINEKPPDPLTIQYICCTLKHTGSCDKTCGSRLGVGSDQGFPSHLRQRRTTLNSGFLSWEQGHWLPCQKNPQRSGD
jgi:hypothetical protein